MARNKQLEWQILQYLRELLSSDGVDGESVEVALQCLTETFALDADNEDHKKLYALSGVSLSEVFDAGRRSLESKIAADNLSVVGSLDMGNEQFKKFIDNLKAKGFFDGVEEGSAGYDARLETARSKFLERFQTKPKASLDEKTLRDAEELKNRGNAKVSAQAYDEAIDLYSKAIALNPFNAVYFANRAAAYSYRNEHVLAVKDCDKSIELDPRYSKAYSRRGTAYYNLGQLREAIQLGFAKALELDPGNQTALRGLQAAQAKLGEEGTSAARDAQGSAAPGGSAGTPNVELGASNGSSGNPMADMLSNPSLMNMAQQMMQSGALDRLVSDPSFANMASNLFGGAAAAPSRTTGDAAPPAASPADPLANMANMFNLDALKNNPALQNLREDPRMQAVADDVKANGIGALFRHMNDPQLVGAMSEVAQSMFGGAAAAPSAAGGAPPPSQEGPRSASGSGGATGPTSSVYQVD